MHHAILIAVGMVALLSGPICGGVRWHVWNRDHVRNPFAYRHVEGEPRHIETHETDDEGVTV
jgi:hypothetical protein